MDQALVIFGAAFIWFLAVISPGPNFLIVSQLSVARSRSAGMGATVGVSTGALTYASLTLFGLSIVLNQMAWLHDPIRIAGGAYLIYLGIKSWLGARKPPPTRDFTDAAPGHFAHGLRVGLLTQFTNPKSIAFCVGLFAAAVPPSTPLWAKLSILAAGAVIEFGWYTLVTTVLSSGRSRAFYLRAKAAIDRTVGGLLVLLGARLLLEEN